MKILSQKSNDRRNREWDEHLIEDPEKPTKRA